MLQNRWGNVQGRKHHHPGHDVVNNTGQYSKPTAKTNAEANGDFKNVIIAGRNSFILPINIPVKIPVALPSVALTGLQLPVLSGSGDAIDDSKVDSDLSRKL